VISIIAYNLLFAAEPNTVIRIFLLWAVFTFSTYGALRAFDKMYKRSYKDKNHYQLGKIKWLFSFYGMMSGKITKHIFWFNIIAHIWVISALCFNIAYAFNQNRANTFVSGLLTLGLFVFIFIITIFGQRYKSKLEKKKKYGKL